MKFTNVFFIVFLIIFSQTLKINSCPTSFALELLTSGEISNNDIDSNGISFRSTGT